MKNQFIRLALGAVMLTAATILFSRCEQGIASVEGLDDASVAAGWDLSSPMPAAMNCACLNDNYPAESISEAERNALVFMREEEKLARDVYATMQQRWNVPVFANISKAEQQHMNAILCLLQKYSIADPVGENGPGIFQNNTLQSLYTALVQQGNANLEAAYRVGAKIEDLDIKDLMEVTPQMDNADIQAVFGTLTKGSRNHLRAFSMHIRNLGGAYTPEYISAALYNEIIQSAHETGGGVCRNNCPRPGQCVCRNGRGPNGTCPNNPNPTGNNNRRGNRRGN